MLQSACPAIMMVLHKTKLEAVIGLIYLLPFTKRSPSVKLKLSPNAKFTGLFPLGIGGKKATGCYIQNAAY